MGVSAGRILLIPKGDWVNDTTYEMLDWVRHNETSWVCKKNCTGIEPSEENSENWFLIAKDGEGISSIIEDALYAISNSASLALRVPVKGFLL